MMPKKHADEWNTANPERNYVAPLTASQWLWQAISKYRRPGDEISRDWIETILIEYGYDQSEVDSAIGYCWAIARVLAIDSSGVMTRDARPFGAFGPEEIWHGPLLTL